VPTPNHNTQRVSCPHCGWEYPDPTSSRARTAWKSHLQSHRSDPSFSLSSLPPSFFTATGLHPCLTCNDPQAVYVSKSNLDSHDKRIHSHSRTKLNSDILHDLFPGSDWSHTLPWLATLDITPPPFRHNWFPRLSPTDKSLTYNTLHSLCDAVLKTSVPIADSHSDSPSSETSSEALWKLLFLFQALIFCPFKETSSFTYTRCLSHRLRLFHKGDIQTLYSHAFDPTRKTSPSRQAQSELANMLDDDDTIPISESDVTVSPRNASQAQRLANMDEYHRAVQTLSQNQPVATLDDPTITHIKRTLFPSPYPQHTPTNDGPRYNTRSATRRQQHSALTIETEPLLKALRSAKKGTAAGPFADYIDVLRNFALFERKNDSRSATRPHLQIFSELLQLILDGSIPPSIAPSFRCTYFLALHKSPTDPLKLRPIGIGTSFRRILCAVSLAHLSTDFAAHLLPGGQLGIGVHGGIDTIVHLCRAMLESYISRPLSANLPPSHVMLLLDLTNMFNSVSRESARATLAKHDVFQSLLPLFDLLYDDANTCWHLNPDSDWSRFFQHEGFAQGCPLSPVFAALVLNIILPQLNHELAACTSQRDMPRTDTLSLLDDTSVFLPHQDILFFLDRLSTLGRPHGIIINYQKTHLLTSTTGTSPLPLLPSADATALTEALDFLSSHGNTSPEITTGIRLLGCPLGSSDFTTDYLSSAISKFSTSIHRLHLGISDLQTRAVLFRYCVRATVDHLLDSDFYDHASLSRPTSPVDWSSDFTHSIDTLTQTFIRHLASPSGPSPPPSFPPLPTHSNALLYLPASLGGIGFRSPYVSTTSAYVVPVARSIRLASHGITTNSATTTHLPTSHRHLLRNWQSSDLRLFRLFRTYGKSILRHRFPTDPTAHVLTTFTDSSLNLRGFRRDFHRLHYKHSASTLPSLPHLTANATSLTSPWMSLPLHSMSRQHEDHRLDNRTYRFALLRRLRLPLLPPTLVGTNCTCGKPLDAHGDHIFACPHASKTKLSNGLRDTNANLLRTLAPLAEFTDSPDSVTIETPHLAPNDLRKRPADVGMHLSPSYLPKPTPAASTFLAIDVTVPAPPAHNLDASPTAETALSQHHKYELKKFTVSGRHGNITTLRDLAQQNILLLPFSIDHLGGLGPLPYRFYFGSDPLKAPDPTKSPPTEHYGKLLYSRAYGPTIPTDLLRRADENWTRLHPNTRFGPSYHTSLPSHWALQSLGLNLTVLLTDHLTRRLRQLESLQRTKRLSSSAKKNIYVPKGRPFYTRPYTSRLRTLRTAHG